MALTQSCLAFVSVGSWIQDKQASCAAVFAVWGKGLSMSEILKALSEAGLVTILEGPLVMTRQRCSLHVPGQPDCASFGLSFWVRKELRVRDGVIVWVHWEMLTGKFGPLFPLLSCVNRKLTAKKRHFEMPALAGCCGSEALIGDCVALPMKSARNKRAWNNSWLERTGLPSRNCMPLPCLLKEVCWCGSHKWNFFHGFSSRYCLTVYLLGQGKACFFSNDVIISGITTSSIIFRW